jgi:Uma2 family endonuclease
MSSPPILTLPRLYTEAEYWEISQAPENAHLRLELIHGQLVPKGGEGVEMAGSSRLNTVVATEVVYLIKTHLRQTGLTGYVTGADGVYHLGPGLVKIPDVGFIRQERAGNLEGHMFEAAPDLAVEVISESESQEEVRDKAWLYLRAGSQIVWAVYPAGEYVEVYTLDEDGALQVRNYSPGMTLEGGEVLPGLQIQVGEVFPAQ